MTATTLPDLPETPQCSTNCLNPEERDAAWQRAFLYSLDDHSNLEIEWEADRWRELGAPRIADLCDGLLRERQADEFSIPAEVSRQDLDVFWQRMPRKTAMQFVRSGGQCLIAALRLTYWLTAPVDELAR